MILQESAQMYLENILILENRNGQVRSVDLASEMNFSKPSVSRAVHMLQDNNYLTIHADGRLLLTEKGRMTAAAIYQRHITLTNFLSLIGIDEETAAEDACRIEHVISDTTLGKIQEYLDKHGIDYPEANPESIFAYNLEVIGHTEEAPEQE